MIMSIVRTGVQLLVSYTLAWLAAQGVTGPEGLDERLQLLILGAITLAFVALVRWLETRQGDSGWPVLARRIAWLIMLGIRTRPVYVPQDSRVEATSGAAGTASVVVARTSRPPVR